MGFYPELENLDLDELKRRFERSENEGDYDDFYYEEAVEHILAQGMSGLSYLKKVVEEGRMDVPQLRAAIWILSLQPPEAWYHEKLRSFLQDSRERIVTESVDSLAHIGARDLSEEVLRLRTHPSPYVRGSVLRYMSKLFPEKAPPILLEALKDEHPIVRENALDELGELGYYQALPDIRPFLYNQPEYVRQAALGAVKYLTVLKKEASAASQSGANDKPVVGCNSSERAGLRLGS